MKISVVFLDRDGVLNEDRDEYIRTVRDVKVYPFVPETIQQLTRLSLKVIIISNQSGINRHYFSREAAEKMFEKVIQAAESAGGRITDYYYCPHTPEEGCSCRKPQTGMIQQAVADHGISLDEALMVGDSRSDYETARNAGIPFILVRTGKGKKTEKELKTVDPDLIVVDTLKDAVSWIVRRT